jgi:hypothetical protein
LIVFPITHYRLEGTQPEKRHYQDEILIHQTTAQHFELGETVGLLTMLIPHPSDEAPQSWLDRIRPLNVQPLRSGLGISIRMEEKKIIIGAKCNLRMDISRDWRRPRYTYEAGKIKFGEFETNGDLIFASISGTKLNYTIINLTKALFRDNLLFEAKPSFFGLAFDASPDKGEKGKLRYWRDEIIIK